MSNIQQNKQTTISNFLTFPSTAKFLEDNLKEKKASFVSNLLALVENDANLSKCEPKDLMMCAMNATAVNLPLSKSLGYAYVIPYGNKPQFQIGYKGLIQLALRSNQYRYLNATEVRENEMTRNKFTSEITFHAENPNGKVIGYMAVLELQNGFQSSVYMTVEEIEVHALRFSKSYSYDKKFNKSSSKWSDKDARPAMARKTVLKKLLGTYGVVSIELAEAISNDSENEVVTNEVVDTPIVIQDEPKTKQEPVKVKI